MTPTGPRITSIGARTPLGLNSLQVAMCARAAALEPVPCPFRDRNNVAIGVFRSQAIADDLHGVDRWLALSVPALRECALGVEPPNKGPVPLYLSVPEAGRADDDARIEEGLIAALAAKSGAAVDVAQSRVFRQGHAGFAVALSAAMDRLAAGESAVLVGGLESYYHPGVLARLDEDRRLHSSSVEGGIIPSEGAAFLQITRDPAPGTRSLGAIAGVETGQEESALTGDPNLAQAMSKLVRRISAAAPDRRITWLMSDWNGERHRSDEWTKVAIRSKDIFPDDARHDRPIEEMGEIGAATGAVLLVLAAMSWQTGWAPAETALVALHSEGPDRGLILARRSA
ncbi:MAG: hypothetical protein QM820_04285 [Minicystis sp.]